MKDIKYEKDGVTKTAQERFKEQLIEAGWTVVEEKPKAKKTTKKDKE